MILERLEKASIDNIKSIIGVRRRDNMVARLQAHSHAGTFLQQSPAWVEFQNAFVNAGLRAVHSANREYITSPHKPLDALDTVTFTAACEQLALSLLVRGSLTTDEFNLLIEPFAKGWPEFLIDIDIELEDDIKRVHESHRDRVSHLAPGGSRGARPSPTGPQGGGKRGRKPSDTAASGPTILEDDMAALRAALLKDEEEVVAPESENLRSALADFFAEDDEIPDGTSVVPTEDTSWFEAGEVDNRTEAVDVIEKPKGTQVLINKRMGGFIITVPGDLTPLHRGILSEETAYTLVADREWEIVNDLRETTKEDKVKEKIEERLSKYKAIEKAVQPAEEAAISFGEDEGEELEEASVSSEEEVVESETSEEASSSGDGQETGDNGRVGTPEVVEEDNWFS